MIRRSSARRAAGVAALWASVASGAAAQELVLRRYTAQDGLPQNSAQELLVDGRDYLWVGTFDGLARFDGERFVSYGAAQGLAPVQITCLHEDRRGQLWVCTPLALMRLREEEAVGSPAAGPVPPVFVEQRIHGTGAWVANLIFDDRDRPWWLSDVGVHRGQPEADGSWSDTLVVPGERIPSRVSKWYKPVAQDEAGRLFFGVGDRLVVVRDGQAVVHEPPAGQKGEPLTGILADAAGQLVVSFRRALLTFAPDGPPETRWQRLAAAPEDADFTGALARDADGWVLAGMLKGALRVKAGRQEAWTTANGLPAGVVQALALGRGGRVWMGTGQGLVMLVPGIVQFNSPTFPLLNLSRIVIGPGGRTYSSTDEGVAEIADGRVTFVPGSDRPPFAPVGRRLLCDRAGDFWLGTDDGLFVGPGPRLDLRRMRRLGPPDGLPAAGLSISRPSGGLFLDSAGAVWVLAQDERVFRCAGPAATPRCRAAGDLPGPPDDPIDGIFGPDRDSLWVLRHGGVHLRRPDGRTEHWEATAGLHQPLGSGLLDREGRFWVGSRVHGAALIDARGGAARPQPYTTHEGLSSDRVFCIGEGANGRVFFGGARGVDRLDPATGRVWPVVSGLTVRHCAVDAQGIVWGATTLGVVRYDPGGAWGVPPPPPVYLSALRVAGAALRLPERGVRALPELSLPSGRNNMIVEYVAPTLDDPGGIRYQHRLEGADTDWSAPSAERSVHYAQLAPGRYRFAVRAVNAEGAVSEPGAIVPFRVQAPLWQRGWFQVLAAAAVAGLVFGVQRLRLQRILAVQRVRRQIAGDLHDEMGSGLGSIGILAGLASGPALGETERRDLARQIAGTAADLGAALSDIVWFLRPGSARLDQLASHLGEQGARLFPGSGARFEAHLPQAWSGDVLALDVGRSVYLIGLEALHNAAQHAGARTVVLELVREGRRWRLSVADDGRGLAASTLAQADSGAAGHGLLNMRRRAEAIGASLAWRGREGGGTVVELRFDPRGRGRGQVA